jgi:hypothetical protein
MTLEEAQKLKAGDIVQYLDKHCMIAMITYPGGPHPYFHLVTKRTETVAMQDKVSRNAVSYVLIEKI